MLQKYLLSYSRDNIDEINIIARVLMMHGIKIWQDVKNLATGLSEEIIRKAIQEECSGLIFYSTKESVKSDFIRNIELFEAERRYNKDNSFHIVPIFKLPIADTNQSLQGVLTIPISSFNGVEIRPGQLDLFQIAQQASEIILKKIDFGNQKHLSIGLVSKQETSGSQKIDLDIDFTPYFLDKLLPEQQLWKTEFIPALLLIKKILLEKGVKLLRLYAFANLSLGFLFGYVFRDRTNFQLEIEQIGKGSSEIWATNSSPEELPIDIVKKSGDVASKDLCVKINLTARTDDSVLAYIKKNNLKFRAVLELSAPKHPLTITNGQAIAIANRLAEEIKKLHSKYQTNRAHIFAAIPLGLATFIGYKLNACGKIQCYEFDPSREYVPSCNLDSTF